MPMCLKERIVKLRTFVLPGDVPLLLGIEAMRLMKGKVDMEHNTIELFPDKYQ